MEIHSLYLEKIRQHFYLCEFSLAEKAIKEHLLDFPDDHVSYMNLYFVNLAMDQFEAAKCSFQKAISIKSNAYFEFDNRCILNFHYVANNLTQEEKNTLFTALKNLK